jgi:hypothetical protein
MLHSGQRLANPGLSGFSSNSSPQTAQILVGYDIVTILAKRMSGSVLRLRRRLMYIDLLCSRGLQNVATF